MIIKVSTLKEGQTNDYVSVFRLQRVGSGVDTLTGSTLHSGVHYWDKGDPVSTNTMTPRCDETRDM